MIEGDALVGANLADLRERAKMTQKELADAMRAEGHKWSQATVWSVEKGERPLRLIEALDAAHVLGVTVDDLWAPSDVAAASASLHEATTGLSDVIVRCQILGEAWRTQTALVADAISRLEGLGVGAKFNAPSADSIEFRLWAAKKQLESSSAEKMMSIFMNDRQWLDEEDDGEHCETP